MDSFYAISWRGDNLSRGAFDARLYAAGGAGYEEDADSPAVDAGSKDFLNGGTTSTNCTEITDILIPTQYDNPPPKILDDFDNQHVDWENHEGEILNWEDPNAITCGSRDDLDIGYHYWGAGYYRPEGKDYQVTTNPNQYEIMVTLRHPKEAFGVFEYEFNGEEGDFYPVIHHSMLNHQPDVSVASSSYNGENITMTCFAAEPVDYQQYDERPAIIYYRIFRGDSDEQDVVCEFEKEEISVGEEETIFHYPRINNLDVVSGQDASGTMSEPFYLAACVRLMGMLPEGGDDNWVGSTMRVFRYEPVQESWTEIADHTYMYDYEEPDNPIQIFHDVSMAADGNDLTLIWLQDDMYSTGTAAHLWGYRLPNASTRTTSMNQFADNKGKIREINRAVDSGIQYESRVDSDWDDDISKPRITWSEYDSTLQKFKTWAAQVTYDFYTNQPNGVYQRYCISRDNPLYTTKNPTIAVNRYCFDSIDPDDTGVYEAFVTYTYTDTFEIVNLESIDGIDYWLPPETVIDDGVHHWETAVTYRGYGTPKHIWIQYCKVQTNSGILDRIYRTGKGCNICTNRSNLKDIFCGYSEYEGTDCQIITRQLEP